MTFTLGNLRGMPVYNKLTLKCREHSVLISLSADLRGGGSGTLVTYEGLCGILTATHVIASNPKARSIFSPVMKSQDPTIFLNKEIEIINLIYLETPEGIEALRGKLWQEGTLDICLIQIDPKEFASILETSGKRSVDLSLHKISYKNDFAKYCSNDRVMDWSWAVDGCPREGCTQNDKRVMKSKFDGLYVCGGAVQGSTFRTHPLTKVVSPYDTEADISCHDLGPTIDAIPHNFDGISGGGMWQVAFGGHQDFPETIEEMFFSGVCVSGIEGKCLFARGPSALYDIFTRYLDTL